jgi:hypothetical protein
VKRFSLCCWHCRRRSLPPSCLFLGRRVYWGAVVLVVVTLRQQRAEGFSARKVRELFGISHQTLLRWMAFYREIFPASQAWKQRRGLLGVEVRNDRLPASLVEYYVRFYDSAAEGVCGCLCFLAAGCVELLDGELARGSLRDGPAHAEDGGIRPGRA